MTRLADCALPGGIDIRLSTLSSSIVQDADAVDAALAYTVYRSTTTQRWLS